MPKYQINPSHLEDKGGAERLKRDGFTRADISQALYKHTEGASQQKRNEIMSNLFHPDRHKGER